LLPLLPVWPGLEKFAFGRNVWAFGAIFLL
jgi:hypothetical protein